MNLVFPEYPMPYPSTAAGIGQSPRDIVAGPKNTEDVELGNF